MKILATQYSLATKSLEIYISGCNGNPKCKGCYNQEGWDFDVGSNYDQKYLESIINKVKIFDTLIDNVWILGGEPLDQNTDEFVSFLSDIEKINKTTWLFTRYELENITENISKYFNYIKCGKYLENLATNNNIQYGIKLATSNQKIYKKGIDF
jgi:anaerobic ribonucleoside-triphosphate reductase activating protein